MRSKTLISLTQMLILILRKLKKSQSLNQLEEVSFENLQARYRTLQVVRR